MIRAAQGAVNLLSQAERERLDEEASRNLEDDRRVYSTYVLVAVDVCHVPAEERIY